MRCQADRVLAADGGHPVSRLGHALHFQDLRVYQKARAVSDRVFLLTCGFPREELYSLTDQLRRSSRSIGAQIAEAWGKRRYQRHFMSKLTDADSEQLETQHWIAVAASCGYLEGPDASTILAELEEIGRMLNAMVARSRQFCSPTGSSLP